MPKFQSIGSVAGLRAKDKGLVSRVHTSLILRDAERSISRAIEHKLPFKVISLKQSSLTVGVLHPSIAERIRRFEESVLDELRSLYPNEEIRRLNYKIISDYEIA
jgi:hypothetical protein